MSRELNAGTCPICNGLWMVVKTGRNAGRLVNHGYQRPWEGLQTKGCFGEKALPYEKSTDALVAYITHLEPVLATYREGLAKLEARPESIGDRRVYTPQDKPRPQIDRAHVNYEYSLERAISEQKTYVTQLEREIQTAQERIDNWPGERPLKHKEPADKESLTDKLVVGQKYRLYGKVVTLKAKGIEMGGFHRSFDGALVQFQEGPAKGKERKVRARQLKPFDGKE